MKYLTDELKSEVERLAGLMFSGSDIVIILELDAFNGKPFDKQRRDLADFDLAFKKGRLLSEADLRTSILELAKNGSSPAQSLAVGILRDSKMSDLDD